MPIYVRYHLEPKSYRRFIAFYSPLPPGLPFPFPGSLFRWQDRSCFVLPSRCFSRALPEFHLLCASGATGEDRRTLDAALEELSAVSELGFGLPPSLSVCVRAIFYEKSSFSYVSIATVRGL